MKVIILDDWENQLANNRAIEKLRENFDVEIYHDKPSQDELITRLKQGDIVIPIRERTKFTKELLNEMKNIKLIAQTGGGLGHIDIDEASRLKIPVATTPGGSKAVVELVFSFILAFSKKLLKVDDELKNGMWNDHVGLSLENKTIGIIGLGKVGSGIAKVAKAFDMRVVSWGPRLTKERADAQEVEYCSLEELLGKSDFVTINVRLVPETTNLIKAEHFQLMKKDVFFINTSRGKVVEEEGLIAALADGQIAGAGLDVFHEEPLSENHPFTQMSNVILSPHIGWKTDVMFDRFLTESINNIESYIVDKQPLRIVNLPEVIDSK
jgi:D-3-phosphoglycerate dehydrogenase / 2-oxoglutarate reductase